MSCQGSLMDLPQHIILEILSSLPAKYVIHCQCVCKTWLRLLSSPDFADLHLSKSPKGIILNHPNSDPYISDNKGIKLVELIEEPDSHDVRDGPTIMLDFNRGSPNVQPEVLIGSCNGLLCLNHLQGDSLYVCNPILGEYITLPKAWGDRKYPNLVAHGFGFCSRKNAYKVVRIFLESVSSDQDGWCTYCKSEGQVYTLGTGSWRSVGYVSYSFGCRLSGTELHEKLHWLVVDPKKRDAICAFDLEKETFEPFPAPSGLGVDMLATLGVLEGCLCLCYNASDFDLEIWVMKEYGLKKSWVKEFVISKEGEYWLSYIHVHALKTLKDGSILFRYWDDYLFSYHPGKRNMKILNVIERYFDTSLHVTSFISLKTFNSEEVKKF